MATKRFGLALAVAFVWCGRVGAAAAALPSPALPAALPVPADSQLAPLGFSDFLARVAQGNLDLVAQRANVSIAAAQIELARIFPDPQVTAGVLQYDLS